MASDIIIRKAVAQDALNILPLMDQLGYTQTLEILEKQIDIFLKKEGYEIFVADEAGCVVGLIAWSKSHFFVSSAVRIHVESLIVDKAFRGKGIGKKLMNKVEEFAQQMTPCVIDFTSGLRRAKDGTHDFYKSLGYHNEGFMAKLYLRKEIS